MPQINQQQEKASGLTVRNAIVLHPLVLSPKNIRKVKLNMTGTQGVQLSLQALFQNLKSQSQVCPSPEHAETSDLSMLPQVIMMGLLLKNLLMRLDPLGRDQKKMFRRHQLLCPTHQGEGDHPKSAGMCHLLKLKP